MSVSAQFKYPATLAPKVVEFITAFYAISDDSSAPAVDKYLTFLTEDCDFIMGSAAMKGHEAVRKMRQNMWSGVATRRHVPAQVFATDAEGDLMLYGTVDYGLRNGQSLDGVGWAARMLFAKDGGELRMARYQVWLDSAPLAKALQS